MVIQDQGIYELPKNYHQYGTVYFSNFPKSRYYISPKIDLKKDKIFIHVEISVFAKGRWIKAGRIRIYEDELSYILQHARDFKRRIENGEIDISKLPKYKKKEERKSGE